MSRKSSKMDMWRRHSMFGVDYASEVRFRDCLKDAIHKVAKQGSDDAVKVANNWTDVLKSNIINE